MVYSRVEKDAVLSLLSLSEADYSQNKATQKGTTNLNAHTLRLDYALFDSVQLTAKIAFINALDRDASNAALIGNSTLARTQLDAVLKLRHARAGRRNAHHPSILPF